MVYKLTEDTLYAYYAKGAAEWIKSRAETTATGYKWWIIHHARPPLPQCEEEDYYTLFCEGGSGIDWFLADLYKETGDTSYREYAVGFINWLNEIKVNIDGGSYA
jgi:hypothetical protein